MKQTGDLIKQHPVDHASVTVDPGLLSSIAADLQEHAGGYMPRANWIVLDAAETLE